MDVGAFVQENKRWLLGCSIGSIVWLIGSTVIESMYDPVYTSQKKLGAATSLLDGEALIAATKEGELLTAERKRLQAELAFVPSPKYQLAGQGAADEYLLQVGRALRTSIRTLAEERDVLVQDKDVWWDVPTGVDEIRGVLFGLELLDETCKRLIAAHDKVRAANPDAMGLRSILSLKLEGRRGQRPANRSTRTGEIDLRDLVVQEQVMFQFLSDEATFATFLESCREPDRTLVLQTWFVTKPARAGEPCTVKGSLQGIAFKGK